MHAASLVAEPAPSRLEQRLAPLRGLPALLQQRLAAYLIGRAVPFVGTGGVRVRALGRERVELELPLRRRVANHLGSVHAAALALLAETTGGLAFAMHLPAHRTPVVKRMDIAYRRIAKGGLCARASVPAEALRSLHADEQGELLLPIEVTDELGGDLVTCHLVYAWFTRGSGARP